MISDLPTRPVSLDFEPAIPETSWDFADEDTEPECRPLHADPAVAVPWGDA